MGVQNRRELAYPNQKSPLKSQFQHQIVESQERNNYTTNIVDKAIGWLQKIATSLGEDMENVDKSVYHNCDINGVNRVIRIANHRGNASKFAIHQELNGNLGIVIKMNEKHFQPNNRVEYVEEVFFPDKLTDAKVDAIIAGV